MASRIRRASMEHLELYDLDKLNSILTSKNRQIRPPLPPPRKHQHQRLKKLSSERYQSLCNTKCCKTDSIYAATPMFTTLPSSIHVKHRHHLLGSYIPGYVIRPLKNNADKSDESENIDSNENSKKNQENEEEKPDDDDDRGGGDDDDDDGDDDGDDGGKNQSGSKSSSSSSSSSDDDDDILDNDDDNNKSVVEKIFNRDKT